MKCISPVFIKKSRQFVPCGRCNFCLAVKRADWTFRLSQELRVATTAMFLTLTYSDEELPLSEVFDVESESFKPTLVKSDCQNFLKRLRKKNEEFTNETIRYYLVGEYGTKTARPHYHAIMFNVCEEAKELLTQIWGKGHVHLGSVTPAAIHYTTKYVINRVGDYENQEKPFALISNRSGGLGVNYVSTHGKWHREAERDFTQVNGIIARIPRFLREKIFSKLERQLMKINFDAVSNDLYWKEIERLSQFHNDPRRYYDEMMRAAHESVHSKINLLDKF